MRKNKKRSITNVHNEDHRDDDLPNIPEHKLFELLQEHNNDVDAVRQEIQCRAIGRSIFSVSSPSSSSFCGEQQRRKRQRLNIHTTTAAATMTASTTAVGNHSKVHQLATPIATMTDEEEGEEGEEESGDGRIGTSSSSSTSGSSRALMTGNGSISSSNSSTNNRNQTPSMRQDSASDSVDDDLITALRASHDHPFLNSVHFLKDQITENINDGDLPLWDVFRQCREWRSHGGFSRDLAILASLIREHQTEMKGPSSSSSSQGLSGDIIMQCDQMATQLRRTEKEAKQYVDTLLASQSNGSLTIHDAQRVHLNRLVAQRDQLRVNCATMLGQICEHIDTLAKNQKSLNVRLQSIKALMQSMNEDTREEQQRELAPEQVNHAAMVGADVYTQFIADAERHLAPFVQSTNQAFHAFQRALEDEARAMDSYLTKHRTDLDVLKEGIAQRGRQLAEQLDSRHPDEQTKHYGDLRSHYSSLHRDLVQNLEARRKLDGENWQQNTDEIESKLREARRNLLKLKYQREELEIDGANTHVIAGINRQIEEAQVIVGQFQDQLQQAERSLCKLTANAQGYPELQLLNQRGQSSADSRIPNRIIDARLEMKRRAFTDYVLLQRVSSRVYIVKYGTELHVLKQFSFSDEQSNRQFIKEVNALHKLNHPSIAKIQGFFIEGDHVYVQMEYQGENNMKDWLSERQRSDFDLRFVFHQLAHALSHMHEKGIVHCDLKFENIVMRNSAIGPNSAAPRPIIIDFDVSKDVLGSLTTSTTTVLASNNVSIIAPELVELMGSNVLPKDFNFASIDWWSFGILLYRATLRQEPTLLPEHEGIHAPRCDNLYLRDLLERLLKREPSERITPNEIISHTYFSSSVESELRQMGQLVSTDVKFDAFNRFLFHFKSNQRQAHPHKLRIRVSREQIVKNMLHVFSRLEEVEGGIGLLQTFRIEFINEQGVDMGGLTADMYNCFFREVVKSEHGLFEAGSGSSSAGMPQYHLPLSAPPRTSSSDCRKQIRHLTHLEAIGKAIAKSIYDQYCIPEVFPTSFWKFLCASGAEFNFRDLEIFDPQLALSLTKIISCDGVDSWQLDFEDVGEQNRAVTDENKVEYVRRKTYHVLLGCRLDALNAIKRGFHSIRELNAQLRVFSYRELMHLVHGQTGFLDVESIIEMLVFEGFHSQSRTPHMLVELLREFNQMDVKRFVEFITGSSGINDEERTSDRKIVVRCVNVDNRNTLPVAHTCAWIMDIPDYGDKQFMRAKLLQAFDNIGSGFHIA